MTVQDVFTWIDRIAPFERQEAFDNSGLVVGNPSMVVTRVLFALDATLPVVREAVEYGAELIVTHHPLLFGGAKQIRYDQPEGAVLQALLGAGVSLIAAHTNLDQAQGGTGDSLAAALGLTDVRPVEGSLYLRMGTLKEPTRAFSLLGRVNERLSAHARLYGDPEATVRTVAVGAGAIGEEYALAAAAGAQAFVVGEIKHHELLAAQALRLAVLEAGHAQTELAGIAALYQRFQSDAQTGLWPITARLTAIQPYGCTTR